MPLKVIAGGAEYSVSCTRWHAANFAGHQRSNPAHLERRTGDLLAAGLDDAPQTAASSTRPALPDRGHAVQPAAGIVSTIFGSPASPGYFRKQAVLPPPAIWPVWEP
jgi:hypothetical protein